MVFAGTVIALDTALPDPSTVNRPEAVCAAASPVPVTVYAKVVPDATFVVVKVNTTPAPPSATLAALVVMRQVLNAPSY